MLDLDKFAGHTPGPWESQGWVPTWAYIPVRDTQHNVAATLHPAGERYNHKQVEATARLIASAPELLAEVKRLREAVAIAKDFLEERFDTVDGDDGQPAPNAEMRCHTEIQMALGIYP